MQAAPHRAVDSTRRDRQVATVWVGLGHAGSADRELTVAELAAALLPLDVAG